MSIQWPTTLPQAFLVEGYEEQKQDTRIRSIMDSGPAQTRRRFTAALEFFRGRLILTKTQMTLLKTFVDVTTNGGTSVFEWKHPTTGEIAEFLFLDLPIYRPAGGDYWYASFTLEKQL